MTARSKTLTPTCLAISAAAAAALHALAGTKEQMNLLMNQEHHNFALQNLEVRIRRNPRDAEAFYLRAQWHAKGIEYEEAIRDVSEALKVRERPEYYQLRAETYQHMNQFAASLADFNKAISLHKTAEYLQGRAKTYRYMGQTGHALKDANEAIKLKPSVTANFEERAETYREQKAFDLAVADIKRAIEMSGATRRRLLLLGDLQMDMLDYKSAVDSYDRVIKKDPKNLKAYYAKIKACEKAGLKIEEAAVRKQTKLLEEDILGH